MGNYFQKRVSYSVLFSIVFLLCFGFLAIVAMAAGKDTEADLTLDQRTSQEAETPWVTNEEAIQIAEEYFFTDDDIQYYAYLNYDEAEEELKPVILTARLRIIYQHSWVADGIKGRVFNKDGTLEYEVPEFHDLFPADWDEPVHGPTEVDLEYYGIYK